MSKKTDYLVSKIDDKYLLWISISHRFVLFNKVQFKLFKKFNISEDEEIFNKKTHLDSLIYKEFSELIKVKKETVSKSKKPSISNFKIIKNYIINGVAIKIHYQNERFFKLINPKLNHLLTDKLLKSNNDIFISDQKNNILLKVNEKEFRYNENEHHVFLGKLSFEMLNIVYNKNEKD